MKKKITVKNDIKEDTIVYSHPRGLKQVLLNIIINAIKYNVIGGKITITAEEDEKVVIIKIIDTGIGMSSEQLNKCTIPFRRYSDEGEGAGLGLSITNNLINLMGGVIRFNSKINKGTTVEITINNKKEDSNVVSV